MDKSEHNAILALIDGIQGQLNAVKALLKPTVGESDACPHTDMVTIETMSGVQGGFCNDCGAEFVMGVLDKQENND
jgi:hypothetical protein